MRLAIFLALKTYSSKINALQNKNIAFKPPFKRYIYFNYTSKKVKKQLIIFYSIFSICAFSACYCTNKPGYCQASITLANGSAVRGIDLQSVLTLSLQGSVTFNNTTTSSAIDNTMITASANGKYIYIGLGSSIATTTLTQ